MLDHENGQIGSGEKVKVGRQVFALLAFCADHYRPSNVSCFTQMCKYRSRYGFINGYIGNSALCLRVVLCLLSSCRQSCSVFRVGDRLHTSKVDFQIAFQGLRSKL